MFWHRNKVVMEKRIGVTPLQALSRFVQEHPRYSGLPATYAGRLDPMASGKLLLLFGEECKNKEKYLGLDKEYVVEILLGVGSDTGDVLGIVDGGELSVAPNRKELMDALQSEVGSFEREYPVYSSKTVNGKPLFLYALEGTLDTIEIPTHTEAIRSIKLLAVRTISSHELEEHITSLLALAPRSDEPSKALGANFRITEVRESWQKAFTAPRQYMSIKIRVRCASGAYMRTLAERVGAALGTTALALSIHRTRIG